MLPEQADVVVLGAGPAGLACALTLARNPALKIVVVDAGAEERERFGESVAPECLLALQKLGLLAAFHAGPHFPCPGNLSIWGNGGQPGSNDAILSPMGPPWRLQRAAFDTMLQKAAQAAGVALCWQTRFVRCERGSADAGPVGEQVSEQISEQISSGQHVLHLQPNSGSDSVLLRANWVVDATGYQARFARAMGVPRQILAQRFALLRYVTYQGSLTRQVLLEAVPDGWWYCACLPDQRLVQMFVGSAAQVRRLRRQQGAGFELALQATRLLGPRCKPLLMQQPVYWSTALESGQLQQPFGQGWIAAGDAASSYDPIVARGITKALQDGMAAAQVVAGRTTADAYASRVRARFAEYAQVRASLYAQAAAAPSLAAGV